MLKRLMTLACICTATVAGAQAKTPMTHKDTPASLRREAKISMPVARATALREVPKGKIQSAELERENGKLIYSFDIKVAGKSGVEEIAVDARTGAVIAHVHETPKMEAEEAKKEKTGKK